MEFYNKTIINIDHISFKCVSPVTLIVTELEFVTELLTSDELLSKY